MLAVRSRGLVDNEDHMRASAGTCKAAIVSLLAFFSTFTIAQETPNPDQAVWEAASAAMLRGPQTITLRDQGRIDLPAGYGFVPQKEGAVLMGVMGNQTDERFLGLIFPMSEAPWFITVDYEPSGFIKDDDAKEWDADELLESLKDGTEAANEHRVKQGIAPIEVTRWVESPAYDSTSHQLVWSAEARAKGGQDPDPTINYNTYVLGREGYISLNLITSASAIEANKPAARELLAAVAFNDGKRYGDFNASTDKVAAYGLAALVGGVAAKKLGLLAALGVFLAKFAKVIIVAVAGLGAVIAKVLKRRGETGAAS
jgi:uncharacterized membrane-anchored protein